MNTYIHPQLHKLGLVGAARGNRTAVVAGIGAAPLSGMAGMDHGAVPLMPHGRGRNSLNLSRARVLITLNTGLYKHWLTNLCYYCVAG